MKEIRIHGTRTLSEEIIIKIVPSLYPNDEEVISDAQQLYRIIHSFIPSRTFTKRYLRRKCEQTNTLIVKRKSG